jgi:hypothetical protein
MWKAHEKSGVISKRTRPPSFRRALLQEVHGVPNQSNRMRMNKTNELVEVTLHQKVTVLAIFNVICNHMETRSCTCL